MQLIALQSAPAGQNRAQHKTTTQTPPNLSNCTSSLGLFVSLCFPLKMGGRPIKREEMRQQTCNKNETSFPWRIIFKPKQNRVFFIAQLQLFFMTTQLITGDSSLHGLYIPAVFNTYFHTSVQYSSYRFLQWIASFTSRCIFE